MLECHIEYTKCPCTAYNVGNIQWLNGEAVFKGTTQKVRCVFGQPHSNSQGDFNEKWWKDELKLKVVYKASNKIYLRHKIRKDLGINNKIIASNN